MKGRGFSNPLLMIRPFSGSRRRKNSDASEDEKISASGGHQDRKVSIDQTVLLGDDTRLNPSQESARSFDVDGGSYENFAPNFAHNNDMCYGPEECADSDYALSLTMRPSTSEPSLMYNNHPDGGLCPCYRDCMSPVITHHHQDGHELGYLALAGSFPAGQPTHQQQQQPASPKSNDDPALQARTEAVRIQQQLLGENHPDVIFALSSLAKLHQRRGNHAEAASILRESQMRSTLAKSAPRHPAGGGRNSQEELAAVPAEISFAHLG